jgi:hypothetical protein
MRWLSVGMLRQCVQGGLQLPLASCCSRAALSQSLVDSHLILHSGCLCQLQLYLCIAGYGWQALAGQGRVWASNNANTSSALPFNIWPAFQNAPAAIGTCVCMEEGCYLVGNLCCVLGSAVGLKSL